jgi:hypothetical protein
MRGGLSSAGEIAGGAQDVDWTKQNRSESKLWFRARENWCTAMLMPRHFTGLWRGLVVSPGIRERGLQILGVARSRKNVHIENFQNPHNIALALKTTNSGGEETR